MEKRNEWLIGIGVILLLLFWYSSMPGDITYSLDAGQTTDFENDGDFDTRIDYFMLNPVTVDTTVEWDEVIPGGELITNGGFESGTTGWTLGKSHSDSSVRIFADTTWKHSGSKSLYMDVASSTAFWVYAEQTINLTDVDAITFWAYDKVGTATLKIDGSTVKTFGDPSSWRQESCDLSSYTGEHTVRLHLTNGFRWVIDDISIIKNDATVHHSQGGETTLQPLDSGIKVNGQHLYYHGRFPGSGLSWNKGTANIAGQATNYFKGTMPVIPAGTVGHVRLDDDLSGVFTFESKCLKVEFDNVADNELPASVYLTDVDYNKESVQPNEYELTVYDESGEELFTTTSSATTTNIPSPYYSDNYTVGISFNDWLFDGWSNEVIVPMSVTGETEFPISVPERPENSVIEPIIGPVVDVIEEIQEVIEDPDDGILQMATRGWLRVPVSHEILIGSTDVLNFDVVEWSNFQGGMYFE